MKPDPAGGKTGMKQQQEHLALFGVGPLYGAAVIVLTAAGIVLSRTGCLPAAGMGAFRLPAMALGIALIVLGAAFWWSAVFRARVDDHIRSNTLVTTGVYAWVRNPIYTAFLMACTGALLLAGHLWLLVLPVVFWAFLTVLMKGTEERWLEDLYGQEYRDYCARVNRCIPWVPRMKKEYFSVEDDGFYGAYYENPGRTDRCMIAMLGDAVDDRMAVSGVKWLQRHGCNVLAMAPAKKDYGHHNYELERFETAIAVLRSRGNRKIGIVGASTTGMLALVAASYYGDITLTIALSPCDFIMEGFYQDGKDGARERPGDNESTLSYQGKPLPYLPYAYRHPRYWQMIRKESREGGDMIASRKMFEESERLHPVQEEEKIKVETIRGKLVLIGAEDDVLWDTCKYIRRMEQRLKTRPHGSEYELLLYSHGTHFLFPESMMKIMLPVGSGLLVRLAFHAGRRFPRECRDTRRDIDAKLSGLIDRW